MTAKKRVRKGGRQAKACERCQKRKIKCDGLRPCLSCIGSQSRCTSKDRPEGGSRPFLRFKDTLLYDWHIAKCSIARLTAYAASDSPASIQRSLTDVATLFEGVNPSLYLTMDSTEIEAYDGTDSIETEIIGEQSRFLHRFSTSVSSKKVLPVSLYFGMYSPMLFFTPMGLSWIIKKFISISDDVGTKETVYLILKYLDVSSANHAATYKVWSDSPLKFYAKLRGLQQDEKFLIKEIQHDRKGEDINFETPSKGLVYFMGLMEQHHQSLNNTLLNAKSLEAFLEDDELILSFAAEYFERSIFTEMSDVKLLSGLISLVEHRYWIEEPFFLGKIIAAMCRRALDMGLNRWEYYVGKKEISADNQRSLWWNCFWWDRWLALITGKPPLISDDMNWCLFPRTVMQLGVDDSMDCPTLIDLVVLDATKGEACIGFIRILLSKLLTKLFAGLLYNRKFSDYRLFALSETRDMRATASELKREFWNINKILIRINEKMAGFFQTNGGDSDFFEISVHVIFFTASCYQAMESLVLKVQNLLKEDQIDDLNECVSQCRYLVFSNCREVIAKIARSKDNYLVLKHSRSLYSCILSMTGNFIMKPSEHALGDLSLLCRVINMLDEMQNIPRSNEVVGVYWKKLRQGTTLAFILVRICLQTYIKSKKMSEKHFYSEIQKYDEDCAKSSKYILDINCPWYSALINTIEQSVFSKEILDQIDQNIGDFAGNPPKSARQEGGLNVAVSDASSFQIFPDFGSLATFVSSDSSLEMLSAWCNENEMNIYERNN